MCLDLDLQMGIDVLADWIRLLLALYFITSMKKSTVVSSDEA